MLRIVNTAGLTMDLGVQPKIPVEVYNPLFNDPDKLFQDISYGFNVPINENNKAFCSLGHLVEAANKTYVLPVKFYADEILISAGNLRFRKGKKEFECNLEPNLVTVKSLIESAYLTDIRTYDVNYTSIYDNIAEFEALMKDTCVNPEKYNYIFFPVKNTDYTKMIPEAHPYLEFMNNFDRDTGQFVSAYPGADYDSDASWANVPFYKLTHILKNVAEFLGFEAAGDFFTDPTYKNYCVWTRWSFPKGPMFPSMKYMPYLKIGEGLRKLRERIHLAPHFDLVNGTLTMDTFKSIKNKAKAVDLTPYLTAEIEMETPPEQGYTVTLKSDDTDKMFEQTIEGDVTYPPIYKLVAGNGDKAIELECSTLVVTDVEGDGTGPIYPEVKQRMILNGFNMGNGQYDEFPVDEYDVFGSSNKWELRIIDYLGYHLKADGKYWPDATSVDLNQDDIEYYRFQTDRKKVTLYLKIPPAVLAGIKTTDKFCFRTPGYNYCELIMDRMSYDAVDSTEFILVKFIGWTINADIDTEVYIKPIKEINDAAELFAPQLIKSYYDREAQGFDQIEIEIRDVATSIIYPVDPISNPTTSRGLGGTAVAMPLIPGLSFDIIVKTGKPKTLEYNGLIYEFSLVSGYYQVTIDITAEFPYMMYDFFWIRY